MELPQRLAQRIVKAQGKGRLEDLLRKTREKLGLGKGALVVRGSSDELEHAAWTAVQDGHLQLADLAALVDEIEECGAKHVFLFDLTDTGAAALTPKALGKFQDPPAKPTEALYSEQPATRMLSIARDGQTFVKQVYTASFWERDDDASTESVDERIIVTRRRPVRAVNVFRVDAASRTAEIRIDRIRGREDPTLAKQAFDSFLEALSPVLDLAKHLVPLEVRRAFPKIVDARAETFMAVDSASDASARQMFSSRREDGKGKDIRDHQNWKLHGIKYIRESINVYWLIGAGDEQRRIHTIVRVTPYGDDNEIIEHAKLYVPAHLTEHELAHVIGRIRHFAS